MFISKIMVSIIHKWAMFQFRMLNNQRVTAWELGGLFATKGRREAASLARLQTTDQIFAISYPVQYFKKLKLRTCLFDTKVEGMPVILI